MTFSSMEHKTRNSAELPSCSWLDRPKLLFTENANLLTAPAHWDDFTVMIRAAQKINFHSKKITQCGTR